MNSASGSPIPPAQFAIALVVFVCVGVYNPRVGFSLGILLLLGFLVLHPGTLQKIVAGIEAVGTSAASRPEGAA